MYDFRVTPTARYVPHFREFRSPLMINGVLTIILSQQHEDHKLATGHTGP